MKSNFMLIKSTSLLYKFSSCNRIKLSFAKWVFSRVSRSAFRHVPIVLGSLTKLVISNFSGLFCAALHNSPMRSFCREKAEKVGPLSAEDLLPVLGKGMRAWRLPTLGNGTSFCRFVATKTSFAFTSSSRLKKIEIFNRRRNA
jgi:hypothetical protein